MHVSCWNSDWPIQCFARIPIITVILVWQKSLFFGFQFMFGRGSFDIAHTAQANSLKMNVIARSHTNSKQLNKQQYVQVRKVYFEGERQKLLVTKIEMER